MMSKILTILAGLIVATGTVAETEHAGGELRIIAHEDLDIESLSRDDLRRIYLGQLSSWDGAQHIVPFMLTINGTHQLFLQRIIRRSSAQFMAYWKRSVFTGKGLPPRALESELDIVRLVRQTPYAIGYVDAALEVEGVRTIQLKD